MRLLAVALAASLCLVAGARAAPPWRSVAVPADGFTIAVPAGWQIVPRSTPQLERRIAELRTAKRTALALQFAEIAAARRATRTAYRFQAFAWPPAKDGAVVSDVTVKTDPLTAGTTRTALPGIAREIAKSMERSAAATATAPAPRVLPAGPAVVVTGTVRLSKSVRSRFALYLLIHRGKLWSIAFRGPATVAESQVVRRFRFS